LQVEFFFNFEHENVLISKCTVNFDI
jgi:hypothetical protein